MILRTAWPAPPPCLHVKPDDADVWRRTLVSRVLRDVCFRVEQCLEGAAVLLHCTASGTVQTVRSRHRHRRRSCQRHGCAVYFLGLKAKHCWLPSSTLHSTYHWGCSIDEGAGMCLIGVCRSPWLLLTAAAAPRGIMQCLKPMRNQLRVAACKAQLVTLLSPGATPICTAFYRGKRTQ